MPDTDTIRVEALDVTAQLDPRGNVLLSIEIATPGGETRWVTLDFGGDDAEAAFAAASELRVGAAELRDRARDLDYIAADRAVTRRRTT